MDLANFYDAYSLPAQAKNVSQQIFFTGTLAVDQSDPTNNVFTVPFELKPGDQMADSAIFDVSGTNTLTCIGSVNIASTRFGGDKSVAAVDTCSFTATVLGDTARIDGKFHLAAYGGAEIHRVRYFVVAYGTPTWYPA